VTSSDAGARAGLDRLAQRRDEGPHGGHRAVRRRHPEIINKIIEEYDTTARHQQPGQHGTVHRALERDRPPLSVLSDHGPENAEPNHLVTLLRRSFAARPNPGEQVAGRIPEPRHAGSGSDAGRWAIRGCRPGPRRTSFPGMAARTHLLLAVAVIAPLAVVAGLLAGRFAEPGRMLSVILWTSVIGGAISGFLAVVGLRRWTGSDSRE
jgi:hypothetical protein